MTRLLNTLIITCSFILLFNIANIEANILQPSKSHRDFGPKNGTDPIGSKDDSDRTHILKGRCTVNDVNPDLIECINCHYSPPVKRRERAKAKRKCAPIEL